MTVVLGIGCFTHDSSAALIVDGKIIAAVSEERFNREKQTKEFPSEAITYCLSEGGIGITEVDAITFFMKPSLNWMTAAYNLVQGFPKSIFYLPYPFAVMDRMKSVERNIIQMAGKPDVHINYIPHHLSHAASTFLLSPFDHSVILTIDGRGEYETTAIFEGYGNSIKKISSIKYPHSVGYLYSAITSYLGFRPLFDEYKVMGLSAYGNPELCEELNKIAWLNDRGDLHLDLSYFGHHYSYGERRIYFTEKFIKRFGRPRVSNEPITQRHADIAFALQRITEHIISGLAKLAKDITQTDKICLAGGVALNCVSIGKLVDSDLFSDIFVQPAAGDAGAALGSALYFYYSTIKTAERFQLVDAYLGPKYSRKDIENTLSEDNDNLEIKRCSNITKTVAQLLHQGNVVGWFQGRMEFGPRALGNRSIVASATNPKMKQIINEKIKYREEFRPFAPSVLANYVEEYFDTKKAGVLLYPYMLASVNVKPGMRDRIPSVVHIDGTSRIHTVEKRTNSLYWLLLQEYYKLSGVPLVLNTSFNTLGEPIVCSVKDAIDTMLRSGLDCAAIGDYIIKKKKIP